MNDASGNSAGYPVGGNTIAYDINGNMVNHLDKGISNIAYNYLNLPSSITASIGNTDYVYRADGSKVKKVFGSKTTDYLDGFQYENGVLQFVPTSEGYYDLTKNKYIYNYTDHLGNVRLSYTKGASGGAEIIEENNYYPFGLKHQGYNSSSLANNTYQYKYNGKELQETGMYDYGARMYMPELGRWGVVDPRSQYTHEAYSYVWNNPIKLNDPTGMEGMESDKCPPNCPKGVTEIKTLPNGEKETQIQGVVVTGKAKDSNSGPASLAMSALWVSQADSPAPGPADIAAGIMLLAAGAWWTYNQFTTPSTSYTTIADPGTGLRNLNTESETDNVDNKDVNEVDIPEETGKRRKNRIPDKGEPNSVSKNEPETTAKKYGKDGNVQKEYNKGHGSHYPKNEQNDHIHDYKPNPHNPTGKGIRQPGRLPKKGELLRDFGIKK